MRTFRTLLATVMLAISPMVMNAQPMSYYAIRDNARYLTDRMAYTLNIAADLLDDLYMINYDYICGVNDYLDDVALGYRYDDYMAVIAARDLALRRLLAPWQWERLIGIDYFYRPIVFRNHRWSFSIYAYDPYRTRFYFRAPRPFNDYRGGRFFAGMNPRGGHAPGAGYRFDRMNGGRPNAGKPNPGGNPNSGGAPGQGGNPNMNGNNGHNRGTFGHSDRGTSTSPSSPTTPTTPSTPSAPSNGNGSNRGSSSAGRTVNVSNPTSRTSHTSTTSGLRSGSTSTQRTGNFNGGFNSSRSSSRATSRPSSSAASGRSTTHSATRSAASGSRGTTRGAGRR